MTGIKRAALVLAIVAAGIVLVQPHACAQQGLSADLRNLAWLAGSWRSETFETQYTSPFGGMILSTSKWLRGDSVVYFEFERIEVDTAGIVLTPYPAGQQSVPFRLSRIDSATHRALFLNPEHDFPRSILFELRAPDNLVITVSGMSSGKERTLLLDLHRR